MRIILITVISFSFLVLILFFAFSHKSKPQEISQEEKSVLDNFTNQTKTETETQDTDIDIEAEIKKAEEEINNLMGEIQTQNPEIKSPADSQNQPEPKINIIKEGSFNPEAEDSDPLHRGWGDVFIITENSKNYLVLGHNFKVTNGPDYFLYLSTENNIWTETKFKKIKSLSHNITQITQFQGEQIFELPPHININEIKSATIWCESFSQYITSANFTK